MSAIPKWRWAPCCAVLTAVVFVSHGAWAAPEATRIKSDAPETVEFFAAVAAGDVEAKLIPRDSRRATVWIENKTDQPLIIRMPVAFAGIPALAQMFPGPGGFPPPGGAAPQRIGFPGNNFPGLGVGRGPGAGPGAGPFAPRSVQSAGGQNDQELASIACVWTTANPTPSHGCHTRSWHSKPSTTGPNWRS